MCPCRHDDTVDGEPCTFTQLSTVCDLLFQETGWTHNIIRVGNGLLDPSGLRGILIDFEDVDPPSLDKLPLPVGGISLACMDNVLDPYVEHKSTGMLSGWTSGSISS